MSIAFTCFFWTSCQTVDSNLPWSNGRLTVDPTNCYLQFENGKPFFWQGETGWLLPERLDTADAEYYLEACRVAGYNVVQVQTINGVPCRNIYGELSIPEDFQFEGIDETPGYGYWKHMDYIIKTAESKGIYIGMVCIWGGLVKKELMNEEQAVRYGTFLAERYKDQPNIVWIIGGDIQGDVHPEVWETLARTIKSIDHNHLMTYHPFGRTISTVWWKDADWIDFHMFQSGHRCYGQSLAKGEHGLLPDSCEEDNWRYVEIGKAAEPLKPVVDGEPSYEGIPYGLHDYTLPRWKDFDVRRYAYWSVFAGAMGHTYGNSSIMSMHGGNGRIGAYGATESWKEALNNPGFSQMQYVKKLIMTFAGKDGQNYFKRIPDQSVIVGENPTHHEHLMATRGEDYLLVYDYEAIPFSVDMTKISGDTKNAWWFNTRNGQFEYIGQFKNSEAQEFSYQALEEHDDRVLVVADSQTDYIQL